MTQEGSIWSTDPEENPFYNFVKVYVPYCTSDVHQGNRLQPTDESGGLIFSGHIVIQEVIGMLRSEKQLDSAKERIKI